MRLSRSGGQWSGGVDVVVGRHELSGSEACSPSWPLQRCCDSSIKGSAFAWHGELRDQSHQTKVDEVGLVRQHIILLSEDDKRGLD